MVQHGSGTDERHRRIDMIRWARMVGAAALLALVPASALAQERFALGGDHVAIYNLVGELQVVGTAGGQVTVDVARGGRDGSALRVEVGPLDGRQTLRVVYPTDRIVYRPGGGPLQRWRGHTQMTVRPDGTWGGSGSSRGERVRIAGSGSGMEAHADLRVGVPRGQRVDLFLGAGRIVAENVDGQVRLETGAGAVEASRMSGSASIRTGSGRIQVDGMEGTMVVSTGSGAVRLAAVMGDSVSVRTGSGRFTGEEITARRLRVRTGSGGVRLLRSAAQDVQLNTGSGGVRAELLDAVDALQVRTGSGGVELHLDPALDAQVRIRTGSGRIDMDFPILVTTHDRRALRGVVGEGRGNIDVHTGSGGVRIRRL
jgi:hypothetical protein